jgi:hypothetical protein
MAGLDIRVGDVVRLVDFEITEVSGGCFVGDFLTTNGKAYAFPERFAAEIISRAETDADKIARLEAELAKAPRRIEWSGGSCPTDKAVVVWQRNGKTFQAMGYAFDWRHSSEDDDIIAYMVLPL